MEESVEVLQKQFTTAPTLTHVDLTKECIIETYAFGSCLARNVSQIEEDGKHHPIAFHAQKIQLAEIDYEVYDKELLMVVDYFKVWYHYLEGILCTDIVYSNQ
jgi:hypothetical protein